MAPAAVVLLSLLAMPVRVQERCSYATSPSVSVSLPSPTTPGNLLVVGVTVPPSVTVTSTTDDTGDVFTLAAPESPMVAVFTTLTARPAQVVTVSVSPAAGTNVFVVEYAGVNAITGSLLAGGSDAMARVGPLTRTGDDEVLLGVVAILSGRPLPDAGMNDAGFETILDCTGDFVAEQRISARGPQTNGYATNTPTWESTSVLLSASDGGPPDAGSFTDGGEDAGSEAPDAGLVPDGDAGVAARSRLIVGCGCQSSDAPFLFLFVFVLPWRLRRSAARASPPVG